MFQTENDLPEVTRAKLVELGVVWVDEDPAND